VQAGTSPTSGTTYSVGQSGDGESVALSVANLPPHNHGMAGASGPVGGTDTGFTTRATQNKTINNTEIQNTGSGVPVPTMPPFLAMQYLICVNGFYPQRD